MAKKDQLAALIESLTPSEKKYFVQFTSLRGDDKSYMKLYDCVVRDKTFNTAKLCRELKKSKANLAHEKEYLTENILKALRNCHDKMPELRLNNGASDVAILSKRELYQQAWQRLKRTEKDADRMTQFDLSWRMLRVTQQIILQCMPHQPAHKIAVRSLDKMEEQIYNLSVSVRFLRFGMELADSYYKNTVATSRQMVQDHRERLQHPLLTEKFRHPLFQFHQHYYRAYINIDTRNYSEALQHIRKAMHIIETRSMMFSHDISMYGSCVQVYMLAMYYARADKDFLAFLNKLKKRHYHRFDFNGPMLDQQFDAYYFQYMFLYLLGEKHLAAPDIPLVKRVMADYETKYEKIQDRFDDGNWVATQRCAAEIYFHVLNDETKAHTLIQRIINDPRTLNAMQYLSLAKVMQVLIHFQLKDYNLLPSLVTAANRYLKKYGPYSPVEQEVFQFILNYNSLPGEKAKRQAFIKLRERLVHLRDTLPVTETSFRRIFYFRWIDKNL